MRLEIQMMDDFLVENQDPKHNDEFMWMRLFDNFRYLAKENKAFTHDVEALQSWVNYRSDYDHVTCNYNFFPLRFAKTKLQMLVENFEKTISRELSEGDRPHLCENLNLIFFMIRYLQEHLAM